MNKRIRNTWVGLFMCGIVGLSGCAHLFTPSTPVAIPTFQVVAGEWAGVLHTQPSSRKGDWVTVAIREDGTYQFESTRVIGIFRDQGTFSLSDGKLRTETNKGETLTTLYEDYGRKMLKVEGKTKDGVSYSANLDPVK